MKELLQRGILALALALCLWFYPVAGFRLYSKNNLTSLPTSNAYFPPYAKGFVGYYGNPNNKRRERVNEGAPLTITQPKLWSGVQPRQSCPGMVGPIERRLYYCRGREYGYCDRRTGVCFCNMGYQGVDCSECTPTHYMKNSLCYPKKACPNDCSDAGKCNYETGECACFSHRTGKDCSEYTCQKHDPKCISCTASACRACVEGHFVDSSNKCVSCTKYDPRCLHCDAKECLECSDLVLTSIRRSGRRLVDPELPFDEKTREFSFKYPFGSQHSRVFDEAEVYYSLPPDATPLSDTSKTCAQGINNDATWTCSPSKVSNKVCGHFGVIQFISPTYSTPEAAVHLRLAVRRSGGGIGTVSVEYDIHHLSTNSSDVNPTAFYTTSQTLIFTPGVVELSFLVTINDDRIYEGNERFEVVLRDPTGGASLGPQRYTVVTIIDDDLKDKTNAIESVPVTTTSGSAFALQSVRGTSGQEQEFRIIAIAGTGDERTEGGDIFQIESRPSTDFTPSFSLAPQFAGKVDTATAQDEGNGAYRLKWQRADAGDLSVSVFQNVPGGLKADYFDDLRFEGTPVMTRVDSEVNFDWGHGYLTDNSADYVCIRWSGVILAPATENIQFYVLADDHVRFWVADELIIDRWEHRVSDTLAAQAPATESFTEGKYYSVQLEYRELTGAAAIKLMWKRGTETTASVIPSKYLFWRNQVKGSPFHKVAIDPAAPKASSTLVMGEAVVRAVAGIRAHFDILPRDALKNRILIPGTQKPSVVLRLKSGSGGGVGTTEVEAAVRWDKLKERYIATYLCLISGTYEMSIRYGPDHLYGSPFSVLISPDSSHGTRSTCTGEGVTTNRVAGVATSFIVQSYDINKNIRRVGKDKLEVRAYHSGKSIVDIGSIVDRGDGSYVVTYTPRYKGEYSLTITINGMMVARSPYTISVVPGAIYGPTCQSTGEALKVAYTGVSNNFNIQATDSNGNIIDDLGTVTRSVYLVPPSGGPNVAGTCTYAGAGRFAAQYVPRELGIHRLHVEINGKAMAGTPRDVMVYSGPTQGTNCVALGAGVAGAVAGIWSEFEIQLKDNYGNDKVYGAGTETVEVTLQGTVGFTASVNYIGNGKFKATYFPKVVGNYVIHIKVNGKEPTSGPFSIKVVPGPICPSCSLVACATGSKCADAGGKNFAYEEFVAGEAMPTWIFAKDYHYNLRVSGGGMFFATVLGPDNDQQKKQLQVEDKADGRYNIVWVPPRSGKYQLDVRGSVSGGLNATYYGLPQLISQPILKRYEKGVLYRNYGYDPPPGIAQADGFSVVWEGFLLPEFSETYVIRVTGANFDHIETDGGIRVFVDDKLVINTSPKSWLSKDMAVYKLFQWTILAGRVPLICNQLAKLRVELTEVTQRTSIVLRWRSLSVSDAIIPADRLYTTWRLTSNLQTMNIVPADAHSLSFTAVGNATTTAVAGMKTSFVVEARDRFGNQRVGGGDYLHLLLYKNQNEEVNPPVAFDIVDHHNGTYTVSYTAKESGEFEFMISATRAAVHNLGFRQYREAVYASQIKGSPFLLTVIPHDPKGSTSTVSGVGAATAVAGAPATFLLQIRDQFSNKIAKLVDLVKVRLAHVGDSKFNIEVNLTAPRGGEFTASYIAKGKGNYRIEVSTTKSVKYEAMGTIVLVYHAFPSAIYSEVVDSSFRTNVAAGSSNSFEIQLRDSYKNDIDTKGYGVSIFFSGTDRISAAAHDLGNGKLKVTYALNAPGNYQVHALVANGIGPNNGGGLVGRYYDAPMPREISQPTLERIDPQIHFDWTSLSKNKETRTLGSVRWTGFLKAPYGESFTFYIQVNGAASLFIDDVVVIDGLTKGSGSYSGSIVLIAEALHKIVIEYHRNSQSYGSIALAWSNSHFPKSNVDAALLYPDGKEILPRKRVDVA